MKRSLIVLATLLLSLPAFAADEKEGVALTVYNGGFGVVREVRKLKIGDDRTVKFTDVASAIDATTVHFKSLTDPAAKLKEQNYQFDLVSADKLLQKHIDQPVEIGADRMYKGQLLSFDKGQLVLQEAGDGGITLVQRADNVRAIHFKAMPEGLLTRPTLLWLVDTQKPGDHLAEVTYQTGGLTWHAEYVLVLAPDDAAGDLSGWVSVQNNSGKSYRDAGMKFVAGDVRKVQPQVDLSPRGGARMASQLGGEPMQEKAFFEYHLYTLPRPSTVADNEVKQLEMFAPVSGVKLQKRFLYNPLINTRWNPGERYDQRTYGDTAGSKKVQVFVEFKNEEKNHLGMPLPAGKVRVYKQDPDDKALEFIGEEQIDHTPKDENLSLQIGNAFDLVGERKQTDFRVESNRNWMSESVEIKVRNHKKEDVTVRIKEPMYRWMTWKIADASAKFEKLDARTAIWDVPVKADGEAVVTYTVEYTW